MMKKRLLITPFEWLKHAKSDLNLAKLGMGDKNILHEQVCFHAQQAAEKALKALLLFNKIDFPLTHDLEELVDILTASKINIPAIISDVGTLTPYAVEIRYPGLWGEITGKDVDDAINLSEQIVVWVNHYIS